MKSATCTELPQGPSWPCTAENSLARPRHVMKVNIAKQVPRPDLLTALGAQAANDPTTISQKGLSESYDNCGKFGKVYRQPCYDFAKLSTAAPKLHQTYSQPGDFKPNMDSV